MKTFTKLAATVATVASLATGAKAASITEVIAASSVVKEPS